MEQQRYDEQDTTTQTDPTMMDGQRDGQALSTADLAGTAQPTGQQPMTEDRMREERPTTATQPTQTHETDTGPLLDEAESQQLRSRWDAVQTGFVDEPRQAVEQADQLVAEAMKRLAEVFATERNSLEEQWSRGNEVGTEELRVALRRYRAFFDRLLSV
jgi:hypothetical protein